MPTQACGSLPCGICTHAQSKSSGAAGYTKGSGEVAADFRRAAAARYDGHEIIMGKLFCPLSRPAGAAGYYLSAPVYGAVAALSPRKLSDGAGAAVVWGDLHIAFKVP
jgi:hypothetical protein